MCLRGLNFPSIGKRRSRNPLTSIYRVSDISLCHHLRFVKAVSNGHPMAIPGWPRNTVNTSFLNKYQILRTRLRVDQRTDDETRKWEKNKPELMNEPLFFWESMEILNFKTNPSMVTGYPGSILTIPLQMWFLSSYMFKIHVSREAANAYISLLFSDGAVVMRYFLNNHCHSCKPLLAIP